MLDRRLLEFYTENWNSIETEMGLRLKGYAICEESEGPFKKPWQPTERDFIVAYVECFFLR